jgi:hypothetical protein
MSQSNLILLKLLGKLLVEKTWLQVESFPCVINVGWGVEAMQQGKKPTSKLCVHLGIARIDGLYIPKLQNCMRGIPLELFGLFSLTKF